MRLERGFVGGFVLWGGGGGGEGGICWGESFG